MRKSFLIFFLHCIFIADGISQHHYMDETIAEKNNRMQWWRDARFGMFIHWGLYAVPAGEWNGETRHAEWIRTTAQIPLEEYNKLLPQFNPVHFDAEAWVRMAKDAGMKYITITSKHHDGFCLWDSKETDFDIMSTPFKRDILKELADACKKIGGIKLCFYHSIMDWHHPDYNERRDWEKNRPTDGTDRKRYIAYLKNQLKELLTNYGEIGVLWFDGEWEGFWTHEDGVDLYNYVRSLQPAIIINNRVDKGRGGMAGMTTTGGYAGDFGTPEQEIPETGIPGVDWESCMTMNDNWGFNKADKNYKSARELIQKLVDIVSKGGNFLLNIGPKADGTFPRESIERLKAIGEWMKLNAGSVYGSGASPFEHIHWGRVSQRATGNKTILYLHVFDRPADGKLLLSGMANTPLSVYRLADGSKLDFTTSENRIEVRVPTSATDSMITVIAVEVEGKPLVYKAPVISAYSSDFITTAEVAITLPDGEQRMEIRYTTDGSTPVLASPLYQHKLIIAKTTRLQARSFYNNKPVSGVTEMEFRKVEPLPSKKGIDVLPGLLANYFEGEWDRMPPFNHLVAAGREVIKTVSPGRYKGRERYGVVLEGFIDLSETELYSFYLSSDDGSKLYIDGIKLIDHDGLHGMTEKKGTAALAKGYHQVRIEFFEKTGGDDLKLFMEAPSGQRMEVPAGILFYQPVKTN